MRSRRVSLLPSTFHVLGALSEPTVLNNLLHGGDDIASPPTHPSVQFFLSGYKNTRINPSIFIFVRSRRIELRLQPSQGRVLSVKLRAQVRALSVAELISQNKQSTYQSLSFGVPSCRQARRRRELRAQIHLLNKYNRKTPF